MTSSFHYSPNGYLHKETNWEPWRLTSQPKPQGGHPPSSGKQGINSFMLHIHMPCICTINWQDYTIYSQQTPSQGFAQRFNKWIKNRVKVGSHHEEDFIAFIHKLHIFSISECPFREIIFNIKMPFWGQWTSSLLHTSLYLSRCKWGR